MSGGDPNIPILPSDRGNHAEEPVFDEGILPELTSDLIAKLALGGTLP